MKKKIFNGILLVAALFATSSAFVSCKDNDADEIANAKMCTLAQLEAVALDYEARRSIYDVLVSDAEIPFCDSTRKLIDGGVKAILQTGGTPADDEFINYCNERGVVMVFTGITHLSF